MVSKSSPTVYLIRHEPTDLNDGEKPRLRGQNDVPISKDGEKDLPKLANFFTANPVKHIVAADMQRHMVTGLTIAQKHKATFTPTASFRPWDNASGAWKNRPLNKALYKEMQWYVDHPDKPAPGGEPFADSLKRTTDGIDAVMKYVLENPTEPVGVVLSTRGVGSTLFHIYGDRSHIVGKDVIAPGGVIRLQHDGKKWNMHVMRKGLGNKPAKPNARYGNGEVIRVRPPNVPKAIIVGKEVKR